MRFPHALTVSLLCTAATLGATSPALAGSTMQVGIADDGVTLRNPALAPTVIPQWNQAGVDVSRVMVIWSYVAPTPNTTKPPSRFDASDPNDPGYNWGPIDQTVDLLRANGVEPIMTVTGPGPVWGSSVPSRRSPRYKPDPAKFATFAKAVAGHFAARVDRYILWNEPNIDFWMQPQFSCKGTTCTPASPAIYRSIALKAIPAIKSGDPGAKVFFGALAPGGKSPTKTNNNMKPLSFLRALGCVDGKLRAERKSPACKSGFKPLSADGLAYHPHGLLHSPSQPYTDPETANIASLPRLLKTLDGVQKAGGLLNAGSRSSKFDLYFTEFGYQTNPPDPYQGVSQAEQNAWLQQSAYIAYKQPRVKMLIQYLWRDDGIGNKGQGARAYAGWQSGLYGYDGRAKPSRSSFPNPFWVDLPKGRSTATVWGQVRPGGATQVTVQSRAGSSGAWRTAKTLTTSDSGYFSFPKAISGKTQLRFRYKQQTASGTAATVTSSTMTVPLKR